MIANRVRKLFQRAVTSLRAQWMLSSVRRALFRRETAVPFADGYVMVREEHFRKLDDPERQKKLFKRSVEMVEIEVFTYCNRKCWFCPNSEFDRRSNNIVMDEALYRKILKELGDIDYSAKIFYSRYNEPFADRVILERLRLAKSMLPNARLCTFTNGDYLTPEYLEEIYSAGLREIYVSLYLGNKAKFNDERMRLRIERFVKKLGLEGSWSIERPGVEYHYRVIYRDMQFLVFGRNFDQIGYDRAGTVQLANARNRTSPCYIPFTSVYIDANGCVVPCCNVRSDVPEHESFLVGDLNEDSIFDIYTKRLDEWRCELIRYGDKKEPCNMCLMHEEKMPDSPENRDLGDRIHRKFVQRVG